MHFDDVVTFNAALDCSSHIPDEKGVSDQKFTRRSCRGTWMAGHETIANNHKLHREWEDLGMWLRESTRDVTGVTTMSILIICSVVLPL